MEWFLEKLEILVAFVGDENRQGALSLLGGGFAAVVGAAWYLLKTRKKAEERERLIVNFHGSLKESSAGEIKLTIEEYDRRLRTREAEIGRQILHSFGEERRSLEAQKAELQARLSDIEPAFQRAVDKIRQLEEALSKIGHDVSDERMSAAVKALELGDHTLAEEIFKEIHRNQADALSRASQAAYGLGLIAEERVDWSAAARHFQESVNYYKTEAGLYKASIYLWKAGAYEAAIYVSLELLEMTIKRHGENSRDAASVMNNLAAQLYDFGEVDRAVYYFNRCHEIARALGLDSTIEYAGSLANLANVYILQKKYQSAERLHRQAVDIAEKTAGRRNEAFITILNSLAEVLRLSGKFEEAEGYFKEVLEADLELFGNDHPYYARDLNFYAKFLNDVGRHDEAQSNLQRALDIARSKLGAIHPNTIQIANNYAWLLRKCRNGASDNKALSELQELYGEDVGLADEAAN